MILLMSMFLKENGMSQDLPGMKRTILARYPGLKMVSVIREWTSSQMIP